MHNQKFVSEMRAAGLQPPDSIEPGRLYRFAGVGKPAGNTAGWCRLFEDGTGGVYGDWASGLEEIWQSENHKHRTPAENATFKRQVAESRKRVEAERGRRQQEAAQQASLIWKSAEPAASDHPYLRAKQIEAHGLRQHQGSLVVPVRNGSDLRSLQYIHADGTKRFLPGGKVAGGYCSIGNVNGSSVLCVAEGYATAASIHEATGCPVAVAFNAGNLEAVACAMHQKIPDLPIVICADDDVGTEGNPGLTRSRQAAEAVGGVVAIPEFGDQRPAGATDFNDMAILLGHETVAKAIHGVLTIEQTDNDGWPVPLPLTDKFDSEPYPLDALPDTLRTAVEEVRAFTKAPIPLVVSSALAALSLAMQAHADVKRAEKLQGPSGLFLLTIADSGERKSTCDGFFMQAIRDYETEQAEVAKPLIKDHKAAMEAWEAKRGGIKEKIRQLSKAGKPAREQEEALRDLEHDKPVPSLVPRLIYGDATPEALKWNLAKGWPSGGVVSSEAGLVFGSHGMGNDSVMRNLATLNQLWDGADIATERRTTESFTVQGARLTIALQVQEATLRSFFDRTGGLARGTGFLARFLLAWPESTQGYRPYTDPPASWPALARFNQRITEILQQEAPVDEGGSLSPSVVPLAADAKAAWVTFHDAIEGELRSDGELYDVRDVASKTADNAARIASLFHMFEPGSGGAIGLAAFEGASRIAAWHLNEARRFYGELALSEELVDATKLDAWVLEHCAREQTSEINKRYLRQYGPIRNGARFERAICELLELARLSEIKRGRQTVVQANPRLIVNPGGLATATVATPATHGKDNVRTVAKVACVAVANAPESTFGGGEE